MEPLAIYSDDALSPSKTRALAEAMSLWYFAADGGMFLTAKAREFYFALQEVLEAATELKGWKCVQRPDDVKGKFRAILSSLVASHEKFDLDHPETIDSSVWRETCQAIAKHLRSLPGRDSLMVNDTVFVAIQQVSSVLRSILVRTAHPP